MKDGDRKMKVRRVAREYTWAEHTESVFSPRATRSAGRVIDFMALKMGLETFEAGAVDAYHQVLNTKNSSLSWHLSIWNDWPQLERHETLCTE